MTTPASIRPTPRLGPNLSLTLADAGAGRPILILHGGGGPSSIAPLVEHFAPTSRVLVPTHPGWDGTPRPDWCAGVDDLAILYLDLLEALQLRDVIVLGSSFGGWIAAEMVVRDRAHGISRLVLVDALGPTIPGHAVRMPGGGPPIDPPVGEQPGVGPESRPSRGRGPRPEDMAVLQSYAGPGMGDPKLRRRLARVQAPTLVVWGEHDAVVRPAFGRAYAAAFPGARFVVIPGAGHAPALEAPGPTLAAIDAFLTDGSTT